MAAGSPEENVAVGIVLIGRNEGLRLRECIASVQGRGLTVYVDSGSSDGSVETARSLGVDVLELDPTRPFSAARARNEGAAHLLARRGNIGILQFVDGDCLLDPSWIAAGAAFLASRPEVAVVAGRLRERYPERSLYNTLCDMEWDVPVGETQACGGIAMFRRSAFNAAGGFPEGWIAGEEPELCRRIRALGWPIVRIDVEMALHDAAMTGFPQWWRRCARHGFAVALADSEHGMSRAAFGIWSWGFALPAIMLALVLATGPLGAALLLLYPAQVLRLTLQGRWSLRWNGIRALFLVLGKFPELQGQIAFVMRRPSRRVQQATA